MFLRANVLDALVALVCHAGLDTPEVRVVWLRPRRGRKVFAVEIDGRSRSSINRHRIHPSKLEKSEASKRARCGCRHRFPKFWGGKEKRRPPPFSLTRFTLTYTPTRPNSQIFPDKLDRFPVIINTSKTNHFIRRLAPMRGAHVTDDIAATPFLKRV